MNRVDPEYVSFAFDFHTDGQDWPAWVNSDSLNMTLLAAPDLTYLAGLLSPAHLRIGGGGGDSVFYETPQEACPPPPALCLTMQQWGVLTRLPPAPTSPSPLA